MDLVVGCSVHHSLPPSHESLLVLSIMLSSVAPHSSVSTEHIGLSLHIRRMRGQKACIVAFFLLFALSPGQPDK